MSWLILRSPLERAVGLGHQGNEPLRNRSSKGTCGPRSRTPGSERGAFHDSLSWRNLRRRLHTGGLGALCVHFTHACCRIRPESGGAFGLTCAVPRGALEAGRGAWARPEEAASTGACPQLPARLPRTSEPGRSRAHGAGPRPRPLVAGPCSSRQPRPRSPCAFSTRARRLCPGTGNGPRGV